MDAKENQQSSPEEILGMPSVENAISKGEINMQPSAAKPKLSLYKQVVECLRKDILEGTYPIGKQLPTESALAARFGVSRNTIREALRELRTIGLVTSRRGAPTTVTRPNPPGSYTHETEMLGVLYQYAAMRWDYAVQTVAIDGGLAKRLGGQTGDDWLNIEGPRYSPDEDKPAFWTQAFLRPEYAGITRLLGRGIPMYELIEQLYGVRVSQVEQLITGKFAPSRIASELNLQAGAPVIEISRTYRLTSGEIIELASNIYPLERFHLTMLINRSR